MDIFLEIKKEMKKQGFTQEKLEAETGIPQSTINRIINNKGKKLDLPKIQIIRRALGMVADLDCIPSVQNSLTACGQIPDLTPMDIKILEQLRGLTEEQKRAVEENIQDYKLLQELKNERKKANG